MNYLDQSVDRMAFVWALGSLCQLHKIPFDAKLLLQQITPPYNIAGLLNAGQQLGLKIKTQSADVRQLFGLPLPCLALMHPSADKIIAAPSPNSKIEPTLSPDSTNDESST